MKIKKIVVLEEKERENLSKFIDCRHPCEDVDCEDIFCNQCPLNDVANAVNKAKQMAKELLKKM